MQRLAHDGRLTVTVLRKGVETKLDVPVDSDPRRLFRALSEEPLSYFIFGPLVFTEASDEYVRSIASYVDKGIRRLPHDDLHRDPGLHALRR